jgi:hypothetical protein
MVNQQQPPQLLQRLLAESGADPQEFQSRSGQGQLYFSAMIWALRNNCDCDACRLLREAADSLLVQPKR